MQAKETRKSPAFLWDIVEESLDEAEFLWRRWESALAAHDRDLAGVSFWVEERLLGALEGIAVAGDAAIEPVLLPALSAEEPNLVAVAAQVLGSMRTSMAVDALGSALLQATSEKLGSLRRGLELVEMPILLQALTARLGEPDAPLRAALLEAAAFHRRDTPPSVVEWASSEDPNLQRAVAFSARYAPTQARQQIAEHGLRYGDPAARNAAIETGLLAGLPSSWNACLNHAAGEGCEPLLVTIGLVGRASDQDAIFRALGNEPTQKSALWALGFAGTGLAAETCVECLRQGKHVQLASDSLSAITGLDLEKEGLVVRVPEKEEPVAFEEDDLDADLVPSPEALLPMPDVDGVKRWWSTQQARFARQERYVGGRPASLSVLQDRLEHGAMRRRDGYALELAIRTAGRYQVQTRAFTPVQQRHMAAFSAVTAGGAARSPLSSYFSQA
jgi:uncharacterized protein (TIGR02270 family)